MALDKIIINECKYMEWGLHQKLLSVPPGPVWRCVDFMILAYLCGSEWGVVLICWRRKVGREGRPGVFPLFKVHSGICCCVYVLLKGVCQNVFTASCLVQYEGRNALPHPPINIIWTHISSHPSLMCCELQQSGHHNPNIRRLPAVKSGRAIWGQA